jgi:hypothetical protein
VPKVDSSEPIAIIASEDITTIPPDSGPIETWANNITTGPLAMSSETDISSASNATNGTTPTDDTTPPVVDDTTAVITSYDTVCHILTNTTDVYVPSGNFKGKLEPC